MKSRTRSRNRRGSNTPSITTCSSGRCGSARRSPDDGAPGLEPLAPGGERADARLHAVGDDQQRVGGEQRGDLGLVGLELLEGGPDRGVLVGRVLQLDDRQRQAVDEEHDVRPAVVLVLDDGELVDGQPVVVVGIVEVDHPRLRAADRAVGRAVLHRHAVHEQAMHRAVARRQLRAFGPRELAEGVVERLGGQTAVEPRQRVAQPLRQHDLAVVAALRGRLAGRDLRAVPDRPADALEPGEGGLLRRRIR